MRKAKRLYRIGAAFDSSCLCLGTDAARAEARRIGSQFVAFVYDERKRHWHLIAEHNNGETFVNVGYGGIVVESLSDAINRIGNEVRQ